MATAVEELKPQLSALTETERAELAYFLLSSLDGGDEAVEQAWKDEVARRVHEIKSGQAKGVPAAIVFAEMRERYP